MIERDVDLKKYNTYGIGGMAKYLIKPESIEDLINTINKLKSDKIPYYLLGSGSNVILPDQDYEGAIIKLDNLNEFTINDIYVYGGSGLSLGVFINKCLDLGFTSMSGLFGIPGTIGGAIVCNAGANGCEIFDYLESVLLFDGVDVYLKKANNIKHEYRNTELKGNNIMVLGATFKLEKGDVEEAKKIIKENLEKRKNSQPLEYKNAGSVFKNPNNVAAGKLIDECGLKGKTINDAMVSRKHANFIINLKNARSCDIIELIEFIKEEVRLKKNEELELEQVIVKW